MADWHFGIIFPSDFRAPARKVTRVFLHCTDSDAPTLVGLDLAEEVNRWHLANGWAGIGYHFVIDKQGAVVTGRPLELTPAAQLGEIPLVPPAMVHMGNVATIAISTHGSKRWTEAGMRATRELCAAIDRAYRSAGHPVTFHGHKEIDPRPCPVYPYKDLLGLDGAGNFSAMPFMDMASLLMKANGGAPPKMLMPDPAKADGFLLVEGCHGIDVANLQRAIGMSTADMDGWFGPRTSAAVKAWQTSKGLTPNGIVSPTQRADLGI